MYNHKPLSKQSGMPQMEAAFSGWMIEVVLFKITQTVVDGFVKEVRTRISFEGTVQPLSAEQLKLKPEGERSWEWLQIHCFSGAQNLETNDSIEYDGKQYKLMGIKDYSLNNYIEYHLVKDYQK